MNLVVSHSSAYEYWTSRFARRTRVSPAMSSLAVPYPSRDLVDDWTLERFGITSDPLHLTVGGLGQRSTVAGIVSHVLGGPMPEGSFQLLHGDIWVSSPELNFVEMASELRFGQLVKYGSELCATYHANEFTGELDDREPLSTAETIRGLIAGLAGRRGLTAARTASRYLMDNARSPLEIGVGLLLTLPRAYGGYGLAGAQLNPEITVAVHGAGGKRTQKTYHGDVVWMNNRVVVEYDSDLHHSTLPDIARDARRRNDLQDAGWRVITLTRSQVKDEIAMDDAAAQIARALAVRQTREPRGMLVKRGVLRADVLLQQW